MIQDNTSILLSYYGPPYISNFIHGRQEEIDKAPYTTRVYICYIVLITPPNKPNTKFKNIGSWPLTCLEPARDLPSAPEQISGNLHKGCKTLSHDHIPRRNRPSLPVHAVLLE